MTRTITLQVTASLPAATQTQTLTLPPFTYRETLAGSTVANTTITATAYVTGSNHCNDPLYTASNGRVFQPDCAVAGYANGAGTYVAAANGPQCAELCTGNCAIANWQNGYCNLGSGTLVQSNWANSTYYTSYASYTAYVPVTSAINAVTTTIATRSASASSLASMSPSACPRINSTTQVGPTGVLYQLRCDIDIDATDETGSASTSYQGCFAYCDGSSACVGFVWFQDYCYYKAAYNGQVPIFANPYAGLIAALKNSSGQVMTTSGTSPARAT